MSDKNELLSQKAEEDEYTKEELTVFSNGPAALAAAVIKQWQADGSPKSSESVINMWKNILNVAMEK